MRKVYIVEYWNTGDDKRYFFGVYKSFDEAKKDVEGFLDPKRSSWSIDERPFARYDPRRNDKVAFSHDYMAGDILVEAGTLFPKYGARVMLQKK